MAKVVIEDRGYDSPCWIFTGSSQNGYGRIGMPDKSPMLVHRATYEHHVGPIPEGLEVDHLCRQRACCNPDHLETVTRKENLLRSPIQTSTINAAKTHCIYGHALTGHNLVRLLKKDGWRRRCRTCDNAAQRRRWHAKHKPN